MFLRVSEFKNVVVKWNTVSFQKLKFRKTFTRSGSYLATLRRERQRAQVKPKWPEDLQELDYFILPNERIGLQPSVNWCLNKYEVTPSGEAYRNLYLKYFAMLFPKKPDQYKAIHVETPDSSPKPLYVTETDNIAPPSGHPKLNQSQFRSLGRKIADYLSEPDKKSLWLHDGAVGSHPSSELRLRVITESITSALYLSHLLSPVKLVEPLKYQHSYTFYLAPNLKISDPTSLGLKDDQGFIAVNLKRGTALLSGQYSNLDLKRAIDYMAQFYFLQKTTHLPLNASVVVGSNLEQSCLVFDPSQILSLEPHDNIYASQGVVWTPQGLSRYYKGISHTNFDKPRNFGDLVERSTSQTKVTTSLPKYANLISHPSAVVFLLRDESGVFAPLTEFSSDDAVKLFQQGYTGSSTRKPFYLDDPQLPSLTNELLSRFSSNLSSSPKKIFVINTLSKNKKELSPQNLNKIIDAILSGKVGQGKPLVGTEKVISSLPGYQDSLDPLSGHGWQNRDEYSRAVRELFNSLGLNQ